jgi:hypothetical protein
MRVLGVALLLLAVVADVSLAQATPAASLANARPIVLVMESAGGVRVASELRAALNRDAVFRVLSLPEAQKQALRPLAVLTVATDHARSVRVVYWKVGGESDALSAATPTTAAQLTAVVYALASALLERHKNDVRSDAGESETAAPALDAMHASRAIYAMLGRWSRLTPRTNVELRFEDF